MIITTKDLELNQKQNIGGAYLFFGEEEYLKRHYLQKFREKAEADPDLAAFNHVIIDGGDLDALEAECSGLALFAESRLIEMRDLNIKKLKKDQLSHLCEILESVEGDTVIIYTLPSEFDAGNLPKKPSAALAAISKVCDCVQFERQTPAKLAGWVNKHLIANGCFATLDTCRDIVNFCTPDMFILDNETKKLASYAKAHGIEQITPEIVRHVCSSASIIGTFDFANALIARDSVAMIRIFSKMKQRKEKPVEILSSITKVCTELYTVKLLAFDGVEDKKIGEILRLSEYPVKLRRQAVKNRTIKELERACDLCAEADKKLKSTSLDNYFVIEQLILSL